MFKIIMELFFGTKEEKLKNKINEKYKKAVFSQRNGDLRQYSVLIAEIKELEDEYERL